MNITNVLNKPISQGGDLIKIEVNDFKVLLERSRVDDSSLLYSFGISIFSERCARFIEALSRIKENIPNCPRLRVKVHSNEMLVGRVEHTVISSCEGFEFLEDVDPKKYKPGDDLLNLGYCHVLEESLAGFLLCLCESLNLSSERKYDLLDEGILFRNLPSFDAFYSFVFIFFAVGYDRRRFIEIVDSSGVRNNYPRKLFLPEKITEEEIDILENVFFDVMKN
jgi:hypothetical protein